MQPIGRCIQFRVVNGGPVNTWRESAALFIHATPASEISLRVLCEVRAPQASRGSASSSRRPAASAGTLQSPRKTSSHATHCPAPHGKQIVQWIASQHPAWPALPTSRARTRGVARTVLAVSLNCAWVQSRVNQTHQARPQKYNAAVSVALRERSNDAMCRRARGFHTSTGTTPRW
jgi:hypothetical protein